MSSRSHPPLLSGRSPSPLDPLREPVTGVQRWVGIAVVLMLGSVGGAVLLGLYAGMVNTVAARATERGDPLLPAYLLAGLPFALLLCGLAAVMAWRARRLRRDLSAMSRVLEAWGDGRLDARMPPALTAPAAPLAAALHRVGMLAATTQAMLRDRDEQLRVSREIDALCYWESDAGGRYTRIEMPLRDRRTELGRLPGRFPWDDDAGLLDGDWDAHRELRQRRLPFAVRVRRRAFNGDDFFMLESGLPRIADDGTLLGYVGTMRELTDEIHEGERQRLIEDALAGSDQPTLLVTACDDAPGWRVQWANAAAAALLDRPANELTEFAPAGWFAGDAPEPAIGEALRDGRSLREPATLMTRYGERRPVLLRLDAEPGAAGDHAARRGRARAVLSLDARGPELARLRGSVGESQKLRDEADARSLELEVTAKELESFSYTVSHDLRAPLRVVEGFARIVQEDYGHLLDRMANDHLNRILSASHRMNGMIDALMALAELSARPVVPQDVDLSRLAADVIDDLRAAEPQRRIDVDLQPGLRVRGDGALLRIVLQNLLGNAWKYSAKTPDARIELSAERIDGRTVHCVRDNGVGFDMRFADRLFTVFQRLHSASDFPGTGVGLATVQRVIRRHGGRVWAESAPGTGARFYFTVWEPGASDSRH
ncbi:MAG TPA: ATP-binding protein [Burkholderiaceae bacterium]|nr:ATP-binding protein [Burkholderiaceae bacterium]